jgi:hypothetical protein
MRYLAQGILVVMVVGGAFNSLLAERTEGVLYAFCTGLAMAEYSQYALRRRRSLPEDEDPATVDPPALPRAQAA